MPLYQIVGLHVETNEKKVYRSNSQGVILLDTDTGKPLLESHPYTKYRVYLRLLNSTTERYLAVDLWEVVAATFANVFGYSRVCSLGNMTVEDVSLCEYTHLPAMMLVISDTENVLSETLNSPNYLDDVDMRLFSDKDTMVFRYSYIGDNEATPNGYAHVNMNLFCKM
jgi:hypothetical protein